MKGLLLGKNRTLYRKGHIRKCSLGSPSTRKMNERMDKDIQLKINKYSKTHAINNIYFKS